ncbi:MAG: BatD family protein [Polyangia bacterium]|jgi:hypothetical protein
MRWNKQARFRLAAIGLGVAMAFGQKAAAAGANPMADISPSEIALDQAAELRVDAAGGHAPALPAVDGLHFQRTGRSTEMTAINGVVSQHTWILYQVDADRPGSYTIPIGGRTLQLKVRPAGARGASAASVPMAGFRPEPDESAHQGALALLRVVLPSKKLFVGQAVPVTFKAYFRAGTQITLTGAPSLGISAFTINHLQDEPRQSVESIGGVPYRVATWTAQASAAMPGHFSTLATLPIVARYREAARRPAADPFSGMLDDDMSSPSSLIRSFMKQSAFGNLGDLFGQEHQREMTLHAPVQTVDVLSPPTTGKPADYNGAVGRFDVRATLAPTTGTTFAPMSLKIEVTGPGNLDRVSTTGLPSSATWKTYPPSAKVTDRGTKVFEQAVVPQSGGRLQVPAVSFSFFDPDRRQYLTRSTAPISVEIAATPGGVATPSANLGKSIPKVTEEPATGLRPNHFDEGRLVATLLPPYRRTWFWPVVTVPWLALTILAVRPRERAASARIRRRALRETVAQHRMAMKRAAVAGDSVRFYEAGAAALRERLSEAWKIAPDEVTAAEAAARLGRDEPIVAILGTAERLRFAAAEPDASALAGLEEIIERSLDKEESRT